MGFRYRRSVKLGGLRINFSKSGIGYSYGVKGLRYTKTAKGKDRVTASIPGTGISYVAESSGKKKSRTTKMSAANNPAPEKKIFSIRCRLFRTLLLQWLASGAALAII